MSRNADQNERMREERRGQILSRALELFVSRGLAATRITDIAKAAGISQGLLYHYFASKEEIYVELVRGAFERLNEAARGLEKMPIPPREKITLALRELLRGLEENADFARTFILTAQAGFFTTIPPEAAAIVRKERSLPYAAIARILRAGQADGSIRGGDPEALAVVFWTMIKGLAMHYAAFGTKFARPDLGTLTQVFFEEDPT